jgi:hypothetical protein
MILSTGKAWAEAVRRRWRNDPWGLRLATGAVTAFSYAALAGACILAYLGAGSAGALFGAACLLGLGMVGLTSSVFLHLPPSLAWWTKERPGGTVPRDATTVVPPAILHAGGERVAPRAPEADIPR